VDSSATEEYSYVHAIHYTVYKPAGERSSGDGGFCGTGVVFNVKNNQKMLFGLSSEWPPMLLM
jgi:hypothetical protein